MVVRPRNSEACHYRNEYIDGNLRPDGIHDNYRARRAACTTISYWPQLKKCWETGSAGDLSLKMFSILAAGIALWVVYGILKQDFVIILANSISLCLLAGILYFKIRENKRPAAREVHR
jgi:MtN3 and saliva related transmembrane protein